MDVINYDKYYKDFQTKPHPWYWTKFVKKDTHFMNYLYKNKFQFHDIQHEGIVLSSDIILEIFNEYNRSKVYENSTYKNWVMEEIFIPTYLHNRYNFVSFNAFCFRKWGREITSYEEIENKMESYHVSIKRVKRIYNDPIRQHIRNKINQYLYTDSNR